MELAIIILEGVIIGALIYWVRILEIDTRKSRRLFSERLRAEQQLYDIMRRFTEETAIERILIFKTANGGGQPKIGTPLYISCIYEGPSTNVKEKYQSVSVDEEYIRMLLDIKAKGEVRYVVEEMPYSLLQRIYLSEGIRHSTIFFIDETPEAFFYGSISTGSEMNPHNDVGKDVAIGLTVDRIRNIFRKLK